MAESFSETVQSDIAKENHSRQKLPEQYIPKLANFIFYIRSMRIKNHYDLGNISAMDEMAVWLDMPGCTTVSVRGEASVPVRTTGHEKSRVTVCLTAKAKGG